MTSRSSVVRDRPGSFRGRMCGSSDTHSASLKSLAQRSPSRSYCRRVISVHMLRLADWGIRLAIHNALKSLNPVSRRTLRAPPAKPRRRTKHARRKPWLTPRGHSPFSSSAGNDGAERRFGDGKINRRFLGKPPAPTRLPPYLLSIPPLLSFPRKNVRGNRGSAEFRLLAPTPPASHRRLVSCLARRGRDDDGAAAARFRRDFHADPISPHALSRTQRSGNGASLRRSRFISPNARTRSFGYRDVPRHSWTNSTIRFVLVPRTLFVTPHVFDVLVNLCVFTRIFTGRKSSPSTQARTCSSSRIFPLRTSPTSNATCPPSFVTLCNSLNVDRMKCFQSSIFRCLEICTDFGSTPRNQHRSQLSCS